METIRNYLETMFASLPNTAEVQKARRELLQMMEDKYTELIGEGKTENEAVGIVISEFGNLDELAEDLGIKEVVDNEPANNTRRVSIDEVKAFINDRLRLGLMIAIGVYLCITSPCGILFCETFHIGSEGVIGVTYLFLSIAAAVGLFVFAGVALSKWDYLKKEPCSVDYATTNYVNDLRNNYRPQRAVLITIGVIFCIMSVIPVILIEELFRSDSPLGVVFMFVMIGIGVVLFISSAYKSGSYDIILNLNKRDTIGADFVRSKQRHHYSNDTVAAIMDCYWPTVTCLYLCWSFMSFNWWITWIIWPVAGIISATVNKIWRT